MRSDPTLIGTVQDVAGTSISVSLVSNTATGLSFFKGESYRIGQVGSFVGDGIVAYFGATQPNPWQCDDAVRAALAMRPQLLPQLFGQALDELRSAVELSQGVLAQDDVRTLLTFMA